jgi:hypothetical protein
MPGNRSPTPKRGDCSGSARGGHAAGFAGYFSWLSHDPIIRSTSCPGHVMTLESFGTIAQIVEAATVLGGTMFALVQLSELKMQRRDMVAAELTRAFLDPQFADAMAFIQGEPDTELLGNLHETRPEVLRAVVQIATTFETMGLLVFRRIAPFDLVVQLAGGIVVVMWCKLGPLLRQMREQQSQPSFAEWFQWLAEQCEKQKDESAPAYSKHAGWVP